MNITRFKTKGYARYQTAHEELNKFVKMSVVAVDNLKKTSDDEPTLKERISTLMKNAEDRWPAASYDSPYEILDIVRLKITQSGIMWVYSAFDVYLSHIEGLCSNNEEPDALQSLTESVDSIKIMGLFKLHKWETAELDYLLPLFKFYTLTRHCVVHNLGKANQTLKAILESKEFENAMNTWPTVIPKKKLSKPPIINEKNEIILTPHHAITYSDICLRVAAISNSHVFQTVGLKPFLLQIAKTQLLNISEIEGPAGSDMFAYLKIFLFDQYGIQKPENEEMKLILEHADILEKCKEKYKTLKIAFSNKRAILKRKRK